MNDLISKEDAINKSIGELSAAHADDKEALQAAIDENAGDIDVSPGKVREAIYETILSIDSIASSIISTNFSI